MGENLNDPKKSSNEGNGWIRRYIANKFGIDLRLSDSKIGIIILVELLLLFSIPQDYIKQNYFTPNQPNIQFEPIVGSDGNSSFIPIHITNGLKENDNITIQIITCYFNKTLTIERLNPTEAIDKQIYDDHATSLLEPYFRTQICNGNYDGNLLTCPNSITVWSEPSGRLNGSSNDCHILQCGDCSGLITFRSNQLPNDIVVKNFTWNNLTF